MKQEPPTVYIIDDDVSVRKALSRLLRSAGLHTTALASSDELAYIEKIPEKACVIADVRTWGNSGLRLPDALVKSGRHLPVIFVTAQDTEQVRSEAKQSGAAGYFRKPVDAQALLDAIEWALVNGSMATREGH